MYVRAGRPAFAWPYAGVHRSTSLMSLCLLLELLSDVLLSNFFLIDNVPLILLNLFLNYLVLL